MPSDVQQLRQHLRQRPNDGRAWLELARLLARETPGAELHHAIEQAIRSLPEDEAPWRLAAALHQNRGGPRTAYQWLARMTEQNPALVAPRVVLARLQAEALFRTSQWALALERYREAARLRPGDATLENAMGTCLASMERYDEALEHFDRALASRPGLPQARLNIAFVHACQSNGDKARALLDELLQEPDLDAAVRHAATSLRECLLEHQRLQPALEQAVLAGDIAALRSALAETPRSLREPHEPTIARLRTLASRIDDLPFDQAKPGPFDDPSALARLEALTQCNVEGSAEDLAAQCRSAAALPDSARHVLNVSREREATPSAVLAGPDGETWLRFWHARLLSGEPEKGPGQYKLATNAIKDLPLTPPAQVSGTYRTLCEGILPDVTPGLPRGLLLYIAVNMIHGFGDGNGRLARFVLAWECETAGLPPLLVLTAMRARTAGALDTAWLHGDPQPLAEALAASDAEAIRLLKKTAEPPGPESD